MSRHRIPDALDHSDGLERLLGLFDGAEQMSGGTGARLDVVGGQDDGPSWLLGDDLRVFARPARELIPGGQEIAQFMSADGEVLSASFDTARRSIQLPFSPTEAYVNYVSEAWVKRTPLHALSSSQLNAFYRVKRFIPRSVQIRGRQMLIRRQGLPDLPGWPFDPGVSRLLRFYAYCLLLASGENEAEFRWFWPTPFRAAMILTHDVETAEGLPLAVELADLEQEHGYRSSFNLGGWYDADPGIVRELTGRGFEIGMHGLRHDRTLFSSRAAFEAQLPGLRAMASRLGAEGFRSPSTYRVFEWLAELPITYDGSIPHSDPFEPQPGGCCSLWPFFIGDVVELPYTLPQDHTLFTLLAHRSPGLWLEQAERIVREGGLIHPISHPDPGYLGDVAKRGYYREFLAALSDRDEIWKPLPRELAAWWRLRDASGPDEARVGRGTVRVGDSPDEVELLQPVAVEKSPSDSVGQS